MSVPLLSERSQTPKSTNQDNLMARENSHDEVNQLNTESALRDSESYVRIETTEAKATATTTTTTTTNSWVAEATTTTTTTKSGVNDENLKTKETIVILTSREGEEFLLPFPDAAISNVLLGLKEKDSDADVLGKESENDKFTIMMETPTISSNTLSKVIEFCEQYSKDPMTSIQLPLSTSKIEDIVQEWYADYLQNLDWEFLLKLVDAANFLDIKPMLHLCCLGVVSRIVGKSADEVRPMFGISNPVDGQWSVEQMEEVQRENEWARLAREEFITSVEGNETN